MREVHDEEVTTSTRGNVVVLSSENVCKMSNSSEDPQTSYANINNRNRANEGDAVGQQNIDMFRLDDEVDDDFQTSQAPVHGSDDNDHHTPSKLDNVFYLPVWKFYLHTVLNPDLIHVEIQSLEKISMFTDWLS